VVGNITLYLVLYFKYTVSNATMIFNKRHLKYVFH
jgi:hypothetical protein